MKLPPLGAPPLPPRPTGDPSYPDMNAIRERHAISIVPPSTRPPQIVEGEGFHVEYDLLGERFVYHEGERSLVGCCGRRHGSTLELDSLATWQTPEGPRPTTAGERAEVAARVQRLARALGAEIEIR
jgi:hypothetical protein